MLKAMGRRFLFNLVPTWLPVRTQISTDNGAQAKNVLFATAGCHHHSSTVGDSDSGRSRHHVGEVRSEWLCLATAAMTAGRISTQVDWARRRQHQFTH
jgi:hypothetical protein